MQNARLFIVVTGTDPNSVQGGIGTVMSGYLAALQSIPVQFEMLPTYSPAGWTGKWLPWIVALRKLPGKLRAARRKGSQAIVYSHCGALPSLLRESVVLLLARVFGAKTILQIHTADMDGYLDHRIKGFVVKTLCRPAQNIFALTPWWARRMRSAGLASQLSVVPNPLPPYLEEIANAPLAEKRNGDIVNVLALTRLVPGKGVDIAIRALRETPDNYRLIVAGDGSQKSTLEKMSCDLGVADRVHFAGWVSGEEKKDLLREADIFCLPSTYDVFPMSVVEAMSHGNPVVASRWGGIPDLVANGDTGFLSPPKNSQATCAALLRLADYSVRHEMGLNSKRRILELSAGRNVADRLSGLLLELR